MTIDSVDKLREALGDCITEAGHKDKFDTYWITKDAADKLIDEIEAEIAERYMELPVDADGVPIRAGDKLEHASGGWTFTADSLEIDRWGAHVRANGQSRVQCANCRHVKPRTLTDVLADFAADVENDSNTIETARKYAEEIRELLGGDE